VSGWFVDPTAQGWAGADDAQIFMGTLGQAGVFLAQASVGLTRPDVAARLSNPFAANSGFSGTIQPESVPAGMQTLSVYVHTQNNGWWYRQGQMTVASTPTSLPTPKPTCAVFADGDRFDVLC
jgi:hypothetical protein